MNLKAEGLRLVDTHCHVDLYADPAAVVTEAENRKIYTIAVTNAPSVFNYTLEMVRSCQFVRAALGFHPQLVAERSVELDLFWPLLSRTRYIGEIGLDYQTQDGAIRHLQRQILSRILERCAESGDKILTLHSRRAADDVILAVGDRFPGRVILHWFSGSLSSLRRAINCGMFFSVNPAMIDTAPGRKLIAEMPLDRVLTETDGPFTGAGGKPFRPPDVTRALYGLASIWDVAVEEASRRVLSNFRSLLQVAHEGCGEHPHNKS